jgi:hypothetical protein
MFDGTVGGPVISRRFWHSKSSKKGYRRRSAAEKVPHNMAVKSSVFGKIPPQKNLKYGTMPKGLSRI